MGKTIYKTISTDSIEVFDEDCNKLSSDGWSAAGQLQVTTLMGCLVFTKQWLKVIRSESKPVDTGSFSVE